MPSLVCSRKRKPAWDPVSIIPVLATALVMSGCNEQAGVSAPVNPSPHAMTSTPASPPPTWVFAGDIPESDRTVLREEMEYSRAYFADEFGISATGFTVLVASDYEALAQTIVSVTGSSFIYHGPEWVGTIGSVVPSVEGSAVVILRYGYESEALSQLKHIVVHEYFHVLQGQLASGFAQLPNGETAWHLDIGDRVPRWLVEGVASYADYLYTPSRSDRRAFLDDRYTPYEDLGWSLVQDLVNFGNLENPESYSETGCSFPDIYFYALSFVATRFLAEQAPEDSYVEFWRLLGERPTWQQAFEEAFGTGVHDFYEAFEAWLPSQVPAFDRLTIQVTWPDMEANPPVFPERLYLWPRSTYWEGNSNPQGNWSTGSPEPFGIPVILSMTYPAGAVGRATLSLWWSPDQITEHLIGWYREGQLTDRLEEAIPLPLTGVSQSIDWVLPAHPSTLPRLETRRRR